MSVFGLELIWPVVLLGAITGMTYGILAVGLILVYRSNRIINFAHGDIGGFGAALVGVAVIQWGVPYWVAFLMALAASAGIGAGAELAVIRRLRNVPNVMSIVATLGVAAVVQLLASVVGSGRGAGISYPQPAWMPAFDVGALRVTSAYFAMLLLTPLSVAALALFLQRSRFGIAIRASAANEETARLCGIFAGRMSTLAWAMAGVVSAYTAILTRSASGLLGQESLGPSLLLRALAPAAIARMTSLPVALAAGIGLGVLEQTVLWNYPRSGLTEVVLFAVILLAFLLRSKQGGRDEEKGSWAAVQPWRPLPEYLLRARSIRNLGRATAIVALGLALLVAVVSTNAAVVKLIVIISFSLIGLSVGIVAGLGGQLSLGQFALAGVGATASYVITRETGNYFLGFAGAGAAAAAASVVVGLPALRMRGFMLAVATLAFALASTSWLFRQEWMLGEGVEPGRPAIGSVQFVSTKSYYVLAVGIFAVGFWFARNIWRGGIGRRMRATRDNEDGARAFTVRTTIVKLQGFALGGVLAGLGGALYSHSVSNIDATGFPVAVSISLVAMTVLGGMGVLAGPLIGALYIIGVPSFVPLDTAGLAATSLGWLLLILFRPGGLAQAFAPLRDRVVNTLARRAGLDPDPLAAATQERPDAEPLAGAASMALAAPRPKPAPSLDEPILLEASGLRRSFGGLLAVDDVALEVRRGESLGLIGPNGAGKTTLFELLSGFTRPDAGSVFFAGRDVTGLGPEARGQLGIIRSFQDASLFPTMTVLDVLKLAQERTAPTRLLTSVVGWHAPEGRKAQKARELADLMGLAGFCDRQVNELSTGTRRITEVACLLALEPTLLLLDEPSSGIAQRETEALGALLMQVKEYLGVTLVVIEHDMPLIMGLSDRMIAMESGRIIAEGTPEEIQANPVVIQSYLGTSLDALSRSGPVGDDMDDRCAQITRLGRRCTRRAVHEGVCAQHLNLLGTKS